MKANIVCMDCGNPMSAYDTKRIVVCRCGKCAEELGKAWLKDKERWSKNGKETSKNDEVADLSEQ